jgi:hypothetical protein
MAGNAEVHWINHFVISIIFVAIEIWCLTAVTWRKMLVLDQSL